MKWKNGLILNFSETHRIYLIPLRPSGVILEIQEYEKRQIQSIKVKGFGERINKPSTFIAITCFVKNLSPISLYPGFQAKIQSVSINFKQEEIQPS